MAKKVKKVSKSTKKQKTTSSIAKSGDGTIQITFSIPYSEVEKAKGNVLEELASDITVPGFRKGKAPKAKVAEHVPENTLVEKILAKIIPGLFADAISEHKISPAIYPKFDLVSAKEGETWQVRATTCELPNVDLGNYKKQVSGAMRASSIWTPDKDGKEEKDEPTKEEREQAAIRALLESINFTIPKVIIDEEVNARLARLLERIEKLGLTLDSYLASIGKTADELRNEYKQQAVNSVKLDLVLNRIAEEENLKPDQTEAKKLFDASKSHKHEDGTEHALSKVELDEQKRIIESSLKKRAALDYVLTLM